MLSDLPAHTSTSYFHVVAKGSRLIDGYIPDFQMSRQLDVLNDAYNPHNITFKWAGADRIIKPEWADNCKEIDMKQVIQRGNYADMNVYFFPGIHCVNRVRFGSDDLLGYVTAIPGAKKNDRLTRAMEAVHIRADTLPGGTGVPFDMGMTLVHEVGHWLGCEYCRCMAKTPLANGYQSQCNILSKAAATVSATGCRIRRRKMM